MPAFIFSLLLFASHHPTTIPRQIDKLMRTNPDSTICVMPAIVYNEISSYGSDPVCRAFERQKSSSSSDNGVTAPLTESSSSQGSFQVLDDSVGNGSPEASPDRKPLSSRHRRRKTETMLSRSANAIDFFGEDRALRDSITAPLSAFTISQDSLQIDESVGDGSPEASPDRKPRSSRHRRRKTESLLSRSADAIDFFGEDRALFDPTESVLASIDQEGHFETEKLEQSSIVLPRKLLFHQKKIPLMSRWMRKSSL